MIKRILSLLFLTLFAQPALAETITVSTANSVSVGDFVGDGTCDNQEITAAIAALPAGGGKVELIAGTYDICRDPVDPFGGIFIRRSNVTLDLGSALLRLADDQDTNVIRVQGNVENVTILNGFCDGNWQNNDHVLPARAFEADCIRSGPISTNPTADKQKNIKVLNFTAWDCPRLCVMLWGDYVAVKDSHFGNAGSDVIELLGRYGTIEGNTAEISANSGHVFGGDSQGEIIITGNQVHVTSTGRVSVTVFRTYPGHRTILSNNTLTIEPGGTVNNVTDLRSYLNAITGNVFEAISMGQVRPPLIFNGGTALTGNVLQNVALSLVDSSGGWGAIASGNILGGLTIPSNIQNAGNRVAY